MAFLNRSNNTAGKRIRLGLLIGGIVLILALVLGLVFALLLPTEQEPPEEQETPTEQGTPTEPAPPIYLSYVNNDVIYLVGRQSKTENNSVGPVMPTTWAADQAFYYGEKLEKLVAVRDNGNRIFYIGRNENNDCLYCWDRNGSGVPVKVAENPWVYAVSEDGNKILFIDTGFRLYSSDLKNQQLLATGVWDFYASADLETVYWHVKSDVEDWLYVNDTEGGELLTKEDIIVPYFSADMKTVYFDQDRVLYKKELGKEKVQISTQCVAIGGSWAESELYYLTGENYGEDMTLYYYDGKTSIQLLTGISEIEIVELENMAIGLIPINRNGRDWWYVAIGDQVQQLEGERIQKIEVSSDGKMLAYVANTGVAETAVYTVPIYDGQLGKPELVDTGVQLHTVRFLENGSLCYYKEVNNSSGELYVDGKRIDTNVLEWKWKFSTGYWSPPPPSKTAVEYCEEMGLLLYFTDWDSHEWRGTLKVFNGETAKEIDKHVFDYRISDTGEIYYLRNFNKERLAGDLYVYNGEETKLVDTGVMTLLPSDNFEKTMHGEFW